MTQHVHWETDSSPADYPPIDIASAVVRVPSRYLEYAGITEATHTSQDLVLFKRKEVQRLWHAIELHTIRQASVLTIVGAPGSGKSSAAYAFACSDLIDRSKWIIAWFHFVPRGDGFICVKYDGTTKATAKCTPRFLRLDEMVKSDSVNEDLFGVGASDPRGVVVFVDGWMDSEPTCVSSFAALRSWSWDDPKRRRLVCVTSMSSIASLHRWPLKMARLESMRDCKDIDREAVFFLPSWVRTDYFEAVRHDELFTSVASALECPLSNYPTTDVLGGVISTERRNELVDFKYQVAGGSAWFMFAVPRHRVLEELEAAIMAVGSVAGLLNGSVSTNAATELLLSRYDRGDATSTRPRLVSLLAARMLAIHVAPTTIETSTAAVFAVDPLVDAKPQFFEHWFWATVIHTGFEFQRRHDGKERFRLQWVRRNARVFDPELRDGSALLRAGWNLPTMWQVGSYDAVYFEPLIKYGETSPPLPIGHQRVSFIHVPRSIRHAFTPAPYRELLERLGIAPPSPDDTPAIGPTRPALREVEVAYVVPGVWLDTFRIPVGREQFREEVLAAVFSMGASQRLRLAVYVVGVENVPRALWW